VFLNTKFGGFWSGLIRWKIMITQNVNRRDTNVERGAGGDLTAIT
jgi:hypothetical protein